MSVDRRGGGETAELRYWLSAEAGQTELIAMRMEKAIVTAITRTLFDDAPPRQVLYRTVADARYRRQIEECMATIERHRPEGEAPLPPEATEAMERIEYLNEVEATCGHQMTDRIDRELFGDAPPAEVSVADLVAAARRRQSSARVAFEYHVLEGARLTDAGRDAAKALARASRDLVLLPLWVKLEPLGREPFFASRFGYWMRTSSQLHVRWRSPDGDMGI